MARRIWSELAFANAGPKSRRGEKLIIDQRMMLMLNSSADPINRVEADVRWAGCDPPELRVDNSGSSTVDEQPLSGIEW